MPNSHSPRNQGSEDSLNRVENRRDPKESSDLVGRTADPESALIMSDDATVISNRRNHRVGGSTSTTEIGRFLEGRDLGPYQLEKFVGGGGMGAVFRALDTTLDRIVAVKVLSPQQSGDDEMLRVLKTKRSRRPDWITKTSAVCTPSDTTMDGTLSFLNLSKEQTCETLFRKKVHLMCPGD